MMKLFPLAFVAIFLFLLVCVSSAQDLEHGRAALRQLVALDSLITLGVNSQDYSRRVVDAQLIIATELDAWSAPIEAAKQAIMDGVRLHFLAAQLFSIPPKQRMMDPPAWLPDVCPLWDRSWFNIPLNNADIKVLWRCTRLKLEETKKLMVGSQ